MTARQRSEPPRGGRRGGPLRCHYDYEDYDYDDGDHDDDYYCYFFVTAFSPAGAASR